MTPHEHRLITRVTQARKRVEMKHLRVVPCDMPMSLLECPPGLFLFGLNRNVGFKSEYGANNPHNMEVYCVDSGEAFWG
jgi:hypothetical protein